MRTYEQVYLGGPYYPEPHHFVVVAPNRHEAERRGLIEALLVARAKMTPAEQARLDAYARELAEKPRRRRHV
jgi:hypothetical protein